MSYDLSQFAFRLEDGYDMVNRQEFDWINCRNEIFPFHYADVFTLENAVGWESWICGYHGNILHRDQGTWWQPQTTGTNNHLYSIFFVNEQTGWACGNNGVIIKTTNGGLTWFRQMENLNYIWGDIFFTDVLHGCVVLRNYEIPECKVGITNDGGDNWHLITVAHPIPPSYPYIKKYWIEHKVHFLNQNEGWLVADSAGENVLGWWVSLGGAIFFTDDGGYSWEKIEPVFAPLGYPKKFNDIYFMDNLQGWLCTSFPGGIYKTTDGGRHWDAQIHIGDTVEVIEVHFISSTEGWALAECRTVAGSAYPIIYYTTDGGVSWMRNNVYTAMKLSSFALTSSTNGWAVDDSLGLVMRTIDGRNWYVDTWAGSLYGLEIVNDNLWSVGLSGQILYSSDAGQTFEYQWCGTPLCSWLMDLDFISPLKGWAVGHNRDGINSGLVIHTTDGGTNWSPIAELDFYLYDCYFLDETHAWATGTKIFATGAGRKIYFSSDGGYNWSCQYQETTWDGFVDIIFVDEFYGWAFGSCDVLFTNNGGRDWHKIWIAPVGLSINAGIFLDRKNGWLVGTMGSKGRLFSTTDGGYTWNLVYTASETGDRFLTVHFLDRARGWIGGRYHNGTGALYQTFDGGSTWYERNNASFVNEHIRGIASQTGYLVFACGDKGSILKYAPMFQEVDDPYATSYSACKLLYSPSKKLLWLLKQNKKFIFAECSNNLDNNWVNDKLIGDGKFPTAALDATGHPCAIWQRNLEPTPHIAGGELWFSRYDGTNWSTPHLLAQFTGPFYLDVNLPSFTIDPRTNTGYVVFEWRDRYMNGPTSHLYLGWFDVNNPTNIQFRELDYALTPARCEFPSISLGGNFLYIAYQREHKIFRIKWDIVNQQIVDIRQISQDGRFSHHPYVDVEASGRINYVWEDSTAENIEIMWWHENPTASEIKNVSETPGKSQWPQICKGTTWITWSEFIYPPTDNNWEICYKDMEYEGYQILSQTLGMSKHSHGVVTHSPYWPPPYEPKLTAIWTEGNQVPYEIRTKTVSLPPIPYFYADAGKEVPSPWTVQRQGYIQFAPEPEKTIDYHPQKLIYHFPNLNPSKRYRTKLVFYFESQNRWRMKIDGDNIFHANLWIKPNEVATLERWLPAACYKDGEIYLNITKLIGDYALIAQVFIYEYEKETKEIAQNTQDLENLPANQFSLTISPNPCYSQATIRYSLPNQSGSILKIYDASGRLVKLFNHQSISRANQIHWNGTDDNGKTVSNGIYFVVLENGSKRLTEKLIVLR